MKIASIIYIFYVLFYSHGSVAMGLRSFVALPLDKGGLVARAFNEYDMDEELNVITGNIALGFSGSQTLFASVPYRTSGGNGQRLGDVNLLLRQNIWQHNQPSLTYRLSLLAGGRIPTDSARDPGVQAGAVFTAFRDRHELDAVILWSEGLSGAPDAARYDISWQYRLAPVEYPDWGLPTQWNTVLELSGRWQAGNETVHFVTAGLQKVWPQWVIEAGVSREFSGGNRTSAILSFRYHY